METPTIKLSLQFGFYARHQKILLKGKVIFLRGRPLYSAASGETTERSSISEILAKMGSSVVV
jgi:hypothetical protein